MKKTSIDADLAQQLIWRSTGLLSGFKLPKCIHIIEQENLGHKLSWTQILTILRRYSEHTRYWSTGYNRVNKELTQFANAVGQDLQKIQTEFTQM